MECPGYGRFLSRQIHAFLEGFCGGYGCTMGGQHCLPLMRNEEEEEREEEENIIIII